MSEKHQDRVVRVFISSTFSDMHAEREELVKYTFPELRRRCRQRGLEFVGGRGSIPSKAAPSRHRLHAETFDEISDGSS